MKEILTAIDIFVEVQETARIIESIRMPLEVAFAKLTYTGEPTAAQPAQTSEPKKEKARGFSPANVLRDKKGQVDITGSSQPHNEDEKIVSVEEEEKPIGLAEPVVEDLDDLAAQERGQVKEVEEIDLDLHKIKKAWDALTHGVSCERMSIATYLQSGVPYELIDKVLTIGFPPECHFQKESLEDPHSIEFVERIFSEKLKTPVFVKYVLAEDYEPQEEKENVKEVLDTFKGEVVSRWHEDEK